MSNLYENLLKATDNTPSISFTKYATITNINNELYTVIEDESNLEHINCISLTNQKLVTGDKVVLGFVDNNVYNPVILGKIGDKTPILPVSTVINSTSSDETIPTSKSVYNYHDNSKADSSHNHIIDDVTNLQTILNGKSNTGHNHEITDVTNLQNSLNSKSDTSHTHDTWVDKSSELTALRYVDPTETGSYPLTFTHNHYFYVNESIKLANYTLSITIPNGTSAVAKHVYQLTANGSVIPSGYRPQTYAFVSHAWYASGLVNSSGYFALYNETARTTSTAEWTLRFNFLWRY